MTRRALGCLCLLAAGVFACEAGAGAPASPTGTDAAPDPDSALSDAADSPPDARDAGQDASPETDADGETDAGVDPCRDAPFETYETFGRGFLATWCAGCHAATSLERFGAPVDVSFDTRAEAVAWGERILARAAVDPATMPPAGGSSLLDRERLRIWLTCFESAPGADSR
jgi:hypothetical protein